MSRRITLAAWAAAFAALAASSLAVAQVAVGLDRHPAQVTSGAPGRPLTAASAATPGTIVRNYLQSRGRSQDVLASLRAAGVNVGANGVTHLRLEQEIDGLPVHGAYARAAIDARGELVHLIDRLAAVSTPSPSRIDASQALDAAMTRLYPTVAASFRAAGTEGNTTSFDGGTFFYEPVRVSAVVLPLADGSLARGWLVETWTARTNQLHHTIVDGEGRVLDVEARTASDRYNVFPIDPAKDSQTIVDGPGGGNAESPIGWLGSGSQSTFKISGNNTDTYLDADGNNRPDRGGTAVPTGEFLTAADLTAAPTTTGNKAVAVQNLFYLNNRIHDILYHYGFNEAAGNFQVDNFGNGGSGKDPVQAEAQDGSGTDNANFSTPSDGRKPRMQMYLWTGAGATHEVRINSPVFASYDAMGADFGAALTTTGITGDVVSAVPADGCTAITSAVSGKIALIDRGVCDFSLKALNAQKAGAVAVIIANNSGFSEIFTMGAGSSAKRVRIPAVMISHDDGATLKALGSPNATERLRDPQPLQIDAALDSDVVYHEYGHGLSWRMIGGMSGPLAGAIGEGNSDGIALLVNNDGGIGDDVVGEYSSSNPDGIRSERYTTYSRTYGDVAGTEVHFDGEVYAAIIWRLIEDFNAQYGTGSGLDKLFGYVVDGMNYTPSTPAFEDMRDGILASVANGATPGDCSLVWQAFAAFGVGVGAQGVVNGDGSVTVTPSFTTPASCSGP